MHLIKTLFIINLNKISEKMKFNFTKLTLLLLGSILIISCSNKDEENVIPENEISKTDFVQN